MLGVVVQVGSGHRHRRPRIESRPVVPTAMLNRASDLDLHTGYIRVTYGLHTGYIRVIYKLRTVHIRVKHELHTGHIHIRMQIVTYIEK